VKLLPEPQQQELKAWQHGSSNCSSDAAVAGSVACGVALLHRLLPYAEHCLLPFCAGGGHVHLVQALLPLSSTAELCQSNILHYARTSAFFAAAAGAVQAAKQRMAGLWWMILQEMAALQWELHSLLLWQQQHVDLTGWQQHVDLAGWQQPHGVSTKVDWHASVVQSLSVAATSDTSAGTSHQ
jgi:hypothetical protein